MPLRKSSARSHRCSASLTRTKPSSWPGIPTTGCRSASSARMSRGRWRWRNRSRPVGELPKMPDSRSGHHGDRPSGRLHQPHRQRTDQSVTRMGGRPYHDGVGADLVSDPAQLSECVTPDGDEGDGDAELLGKLFRPAAHVISDLLICLPAGGLQAGGGAVYRQPRRHWGNVDSGDLRPLPTRQARRIPASPRRGGGAVHADENRHGAVGSQLERRFIAWWHNSSVWTMGSRAYGSAAPTRAAERMHQPGTNTGGIAP